MKRYTVACVVLTIGLCGLARAEDVPTGPAADVPELKALAHFAGKWDSEFTMKPNAVQANAVKSKGAAAGEWVLGGRFMHQTWKTEAVEGIPAMSGSTMMTYDPVRKTYRGWNFVSSGQASECQGVWDEKAQSMTWTAKDADSGVTTVTVATFPADGVEAWTITAKDGEGKVVFEMTGKNTRRKK